MQKHNLLSLLLCFLATGPLCASTHEADIVVYSANSGGIAAAVQAKKMGKSVILLEPTRYIGGLTTSGLGYTDFARNDRRGSSVGGLSREFYQRVEYYYDNAKTLDFPGVQADFAKNSDIRRAFEPHVAEAVFRKMLAEQGIEPLLNQRLDRSEKGIVKEGGRIVAIRTEAGDLFRGSMFIDCSYEGDLMALAGVTYTVGRESAATYREPEAGVYSKECKHQFAEGISPYRVAGDPSSGLLPGINPGPLPPEGTGDDKLQAFNYRLCLTNQPQNRRPFEKPADYDEIQYELLFRNLASLEKLEWLSFQDR